MALRITQGSVDDVDLLKPLWLGILEQHRDVLGDSIVVVDPEESWKRRGPKYRATLADDDSLLLLAHLDGVAEPVGYLVATIERDSTNATYELGPAIGDVEAVSVLPEHRGDGIGTALMEEARRRLVAAGCTRWAVIVVAANTGAAKLYERMGFQPWEQQLTAPLAPSPDLPA